MKMQARKGKHDDFCFAANTMIMTDHGEVPIQDVKVGDMVLTSEGYREVEHTSEREAEVITKFGITATPDHPFITPNGIQQWTDINIHDKIYVCPEKKKLEELLLYTKGNNTIGTLNLKDDSFVSTIGDMINGSSLQLHSIDKSMKTTLAKSQKDTISIIRMATQKTMTPAIYKHSLLEHIIKSQLKNVGEKKNIDKNEQLLLQHLRVKGNGRRLRRLVKLLKASADCVGKNLKQDAIMVVEGSAMPVSQCDTAIGTENTSIKRNKSKDLGESLYHTETVYNMQVKGTHEYYANRILVHNCATLWIFAGTLDNRLLEGRKKVGFAII